MYVHALFTNVSNHYNTLYRLFRNGTFKQHWDNNRKNKGSNTVQTNIIICHR